MKLHPLAYHGEYKYSLLFCQFTSSARESRGRIYKHIIIAYLQYSHTQVITVLVKDPLLKRVTGLLK
uniref:Uncharacterized protein n=1 Tax=Rhizophora mucronata TaxID=61149 RepID=A0A2P2Q1B4_RHIMU